MAVFVLPAAAGAQLPGGYQARGVDHVRNIPVNGSVGANFKDGHMFVTGTLAPGIKADPGLVSQINYGGLWVYDISDASNPTLVSHLPVPHYESEDVSIGGNRLLISGDGTLGGSSLIVIDISDPASPKIEQVITMQILDEGHTATCIQDCHYVWVAGGGTIAVIDLDGKHQIKKGTVPGSPGYQYGNRIGVNFQGQFYGVQSPEEGTVEKGDLVTQPEFGWSTHDVQVDEAGIAWVVGGNGTIGFDTNPGAYGEGNLLNPTVVARTGPDGRDGGRGVKLDGDDATYEGDSVNDFIHHNSWRPDADQFVSRPDSELSDPSVRPGETVLITEEDIWSDATFTTKGGCENQGSFQTWQVKQFGNAGGADQSTVKFLDAFTTEYNELLASEDDIEGMDVVPTGGFCSSHYFDEQDGMVATAWYEQGTRLLDTRDPKNIKQVGYFMAPDSVVWAAYWSPTNPSVIYVMDHQRGIDVLRVKDGGSVAQSRQVVAPLPKVVTGFDATKSTLSAKKSHFSWVCRVTSNKN